MNKTLKKSPTKKMASLLRKSNLPLQMEESKMNMNMFYPQKSSPKIINHKTYLNPHSKMEKVPTYKNPACR